MRRYATPRATYTPSQATVYQVASATDPIIHPSATPTSAASTTRGNRSVTTIEYTDAVALLVSALKTCASDKCTVPSATPSTHVAASAMRPPHQCQVRCTIMEVRARGAMHGRVLPHRHPSALRVALPL